jgi:hypothetical protein
MKIQLTSTAPIAVETYVDGDIVLGQFEYHPAGVLGTPPHFVLVDEVSTDFPILWEHQEITFKDGWFYFEDDMFGDVKFKFAGY